MWRESLLPSQSTRHIDNIHCGRMILISDGILFERAQSLSNHRFVGRQANEVWRGKKALPARKLRDETAGRSHYTSLV
jgi:hypothetical protein